MRRLRHSDQLFLRRPWAVPSTAGLDTFGPLYVCRGDTIHFEWVSGDPDGKHGVAQLRAGATPCDMSGSQTLAQPSDGGSCSVNVWADKGSSVYYVDPVGDHCKRGQFVQVIVSNRTDIDCPSNN